MIKRNPNEDQREANKQIGSERELIQQQLLTYLNRRPIFKDLFYKMAMVNKGRVRNVTFTKNVMDVSVYIFSPIKITVRTTLPQLKTDYSNIADLLVDLDKIQ